MPNTRKILIVDDDPEMRDALTEQLSLHEEFEALAEENGSKGVQAAKAGLIDLAATYQRRTRSRACSCSFKHLCSRFACGSAQSFIIKMAERTQIQLQAVTHMFFSQAVPVQRSRSARLRLENARRS